MSRKMVPADSGQLRLGLSAVSTSPTATPLVLNCRRVLLTAWTATFWSVHPTTTLRIH